MPSRALGVYSFVAEQAIWKFRLRYSAIQSHTFCWDSFPVYRIVRLRHHRDVRRSGGKFFTWLGVWSAIEGTKHPFGSLADLGLLPNWLLAGLPYVGNILSFSVVVIALLAFRDLSQDKLRLFLQGAIVAGLAIAVAGIALFLFTGSSFKIMPYNHRRVISLGALVIVVAVPKLCRRFLVLPNRTVLSLGILLFRFGGGLWQLVASTEAAESALDPGPAGVCVL